MGLKISGRGSQPQSRRRGRALDGSVRGADCRLVDMKLGPNGSIITAEIDGKRLVYSLGAPGRHLVMNSLAVVCVLHSVGTDIVAGVDALAKFEGLKGRGKRHKINICYSQIF